MSHQEREKVKLLQRLRKLRGQLDAVERALLADEDCGGQLMLLAAPELAEDLIDLVRAYLK
jgi:DNA-binding FrmR family transcriptional regulator